MTTSGTPIFIADYEYSAKNEGELEFKVGDRIVVSKIDGDWLYGCHTKTKQEGWFAVSYGHIRKPSPYGSLDSKGKLQKRKEIFDQSKGVEKKFVATLNDVIERVINPLLLRDTVFKRNFLGDAAVAVSFNVLTDMHKTCSNFLFALDAAKDEKEIAAAHTQFAPSLQLFAQYASENSKLINALERNRRGLVQMSDNLTEFAFIENFLSPLQHYQKYRNDFQEYVWLTPENDPAINVLEIALDIIIAQSEFVDVKLKEEEEHLMLLTLQSQFVGNPVIFTPNRKLLKEGDIERVRIKKTGDIETKSYYAHLFNDALIYSSRSSVTGYFKLHGTIELKGATFQTHEIGGTKAGFSLSSREIPEKFEHFRLPSEEEAIEWLPIIINQIEQLKKSKRAEKRTSIMTKAPINIPGVDVAKLGARCAVIYKFLISEMQFAEAVVALNITLIQPLIGASKGAVLSAAMNSRSIGSGEFEQDTVEKTDALFDSRATTTSKYQSQLVTDALQEPDVLIFLRAAESISHSVRDFVKSLEALCSSGKWSESLVVGTFFTSASALALYDQFKSYASGQQAMVRVLKNPNFAQFLKDAEVFLANIPGKLQEKLELPRKRIMFYHTVISDLQKITAANHPDYNSMNAALEKISTVDQEITELIKLKENFEKLLEIQASLITMSNEPVVQKLVSMERKFLKEGDLKKVCRRKNKTFRFWLFHDYLIYGSALGGDKYTFNRALELNKCTVAHHTSNDVKNAFEIYGAEKSFVVIAPTQTVCDEWVEAIKSASQALRVARGESEIQESAPLWTPDHNSDNCTQCNKPFTFWNRRHHCRKCGALVCSEHLNNREIIPHISKTQKQKICDNCFNGKTPQAPKAVEPAAPSATQPAPSVTPPANNVSPQPAASSQKSPDVASSQSAVKAKDPVVGQSENSTRTSNPITQRYLANLQPQDSKSSQPKPSAAASEPAPVSSVIKPHRRSSAVASKFTQKKAPPPPDAVNSTAPEKPEVHALNAAAIWPPAANDKQPTQSVPRSAPPPVPTRSKSPPPIQSKSPPPIPSNPPAADNAPKHAPPPVPVAEAAKIPPSVPSVTKEPVVPEVRKLPPPSVPNEPKVETPEVRKSPPPPVVPSSPAPPASTESKPVPVPDPMLRPPRPPPPPPKMPPAAHPTDNETAARSPPPPPVSAVRSAPPPPGPAPPSSSSEEISEDDPFRKYIKMKELLPAGAVRQKMTADGFNANDIEDFLSGKVAKIDLAASKPAVGLNFSEVKLSAAAPNLRPAPAPPAKMSLLEEIQKGPKLRTVTVEETKAQKSQPTGGLLGMLAMEMSKRRFNMNVNEDEDDSDSGFSDSSSESDDD